MQDGQTDLMLHDARRRGCNMIAEASLYLSTRSLVRREPLYSARRFARLISDIPAGEVGATDLNRLRDVMQSRGFAARTIESTVADLLTVIHAVTGREVSKGSRVHVPRPEPKPVPLSSLDAIWKHCEPWLQSWLAVTYWTGLRISDSIRACNGTLPAECLRFQASKTGRNHVWPVPQWLRSWWPETFPLPRATDFNLRTLRRAIAAACTAATVPLWHPQQLRQRSITEWSRANATAGAIVHGCGLGVLAHYVDPLSVLESAAPRVRVPASMLGTHQAAPEESLLSAWRRCDPQARDLVTATAERMAAG